MAIDTRLVRSLPYAVAGAAAGYLSYLAASFQYHARVGTLGPEFWPIAILALTIVVCAWQVGKIFVMGAAAHEAGGMLEEFADESETDAARGEQHHWRLVAGMAATLAYVALVQKLGFFLATIAYLVAFLALGGYRRWGIIAAMSVIGALVLMFIFMKLVYVSLPIGVAPFDQVTFLLMALMGVR
ncbi:MAG: tripartite tricarboxylate transporter TctB family protein [Betaproteobacteria bacterium]|nr:tripartite tricarboxylate transporter TctB family protein [Betaproteobacteria bacterium]